MHRSPGAAAGQQKQNSKQDSDFFMERPWMMAFLVIIVRKNGEVKSGAGMVLCFVTKKQEREMNPCEKTAVGV